MGPLTGRQPDMDVATVRRPRLAEADREAHLARLFLDGQLDLGAAGAVRVGRRHLVGAAELGPQPGAVAVRRAKPPTAPTPNSAARPTASADFLCIPIATSLEWPRPVGAVALSYVREAGPACFSASASQSASWVPINCHVNSAS